MNEHIHSGPHRRRLGECIWSHYAFGVDLSCDDNALPGEAECAIHFIAAAHQRADQENPQ